MTSPIVYPVDDKDPLDDTALWAVIDSAAAAASRKRLNSYTPPPPPLNRYRFRPLIDGEVVQQQQPRSRASSSMSMVKHVQRTPSPHTTPPLSRFSPTASDSEGGSTLCYSFGGVKNEEREGEMNTMSHSLSGRFPSVSLFKDYQAAALAILEKSDYTLIFGNPFLRRTGWRKISCYFNISYEIKDKTIEFDEDRNVQRAEFVVRAYMHGGRFSDGWGSCERREKRFMKPNNDIPSTAETRAKNKACQDLLGIGGSGHA